MSQRPEIETWLAERGYPPEVVEKILKQLDQFDLRINRDSVFDAMVRGEFDMDAVIKAALESK